MPFTWLDIALFAIMLLSGALAMARGFTREVLSIASWAGAAAAAGFAWFKFPEAHDLLREYIHPDILADIVLVLSVFVITLLVLSVITAKLSDRILDSNAGALDRTLGFIFGLARGLALVVIAFMLFQWLMPRDKFPIWIRHARTLPIINSTSDYVTSYLPPEIAVILRNQNKNTDPQTPSLPNTTPAIPQRDSGYRPNERQGLNQLVEGTRAVKP